MVDGRAPLSKTILPRVQNAVNVWTDSVEQDAIEVLSGDAHERYSSIIASHGQVAFLRDRYDYTA